MLMLSSPVREVSAVHSLASRVDFDRLGLELAGARLLGLLGSRLTADLSAEVPDRFAASVEQILAQGRTRAGVQQLLTSEILGRLESAGVAAMPLKGPYWAEWIHGDAGVRLSADIDILVPASEIGAAIAVFERLGYRRPPRADVLPRLHHHLRSDRGLPEVELHWRLHWYETRFSDEMLARATVVEPALRRPQPIDGLLSLATFYARDGLVPLRYAADLATWWMAHGEQITGRALRQALARYPELSRPVRAALHTTLMLLAPADQPACTRTVRDWRDRRAASLGALALLGETDQPDDYAALADGLLAPRGGARAFVRRQFLPDLPGTPTTRERAAFAGGLAVRLALLLARTSPLYSPTLLQTLHHTRPGAA